MSNQVKPYQDSSESKKAQVADMFNKIAFKYDFLNHFLSLNIDKLWRKKVVKIIKEKQPERILDVATGTGDLAIAALKVNPQRIDGIDISEGMLDVGKKKVIDKGHSDKVFLKLGDAEAIPFDDNTFDALTVAFGVRNFESLNKGLSEMYRVLNENGICVVLEFTMPTKFPVKQLYTFYFKYILPFFGKLFSKNDSAYTYLPESVKAFPQRNNFLEHLKDAGFEKCKFRSLSFGIAAIYIAEK